MIQRLREGRRMLSGMFLSFYLSFLPDKFHCLLHTTVLFSPSRRYLDLAPPSHAARLKSKEIGVGLENEREKKPSLILRHTVTPAENPQTAHTSAAAAQRTSSSRARKRSRSRSGTTPGGRARSSMTGSRRRGWRIGERSFSRALWGGRNRSLTYFAWEMVGGDMMGAGDIRRSMI